MSVRDSIPFAREEEERWLPVEGWPGYDVSDRGRVRSYWIRGGKDRSRIIGRTPTLLKPHMAVSGHITYQLSRRRDGRRERKPIGVHILVLTAFVGPCPDGLEACHFPDPDPSNNTPANLRWDTRKANARDSFLQGIHRSATISATDVPTIRRRIASGEPFDRIADDYGVSPFAIRDIKRGRTWSYVTS